MSKSFSHHCTCMLKSGRNTYSDMRVLNSSVLMKMFLIKKINVYQTAASQLLAFVLKQPVEQRVSESPDWIKNCQIGVYYSISWNILLKKRNNELLFLCKLSFSPSQNTFAMWWCCCTVLQHTINVFGGLEVGGLSCVGLLSQNTNLHY